MKTWFDWMEQYHLPCPQADGAQDGESERILTLTRSKLGLQETTPKGSAAAARPTVRRTRRLWVLAAAAALVLSLGVGAAATGVYPWDAVEDFFGADREQAARLGMPGEGLEMSQSKAGVTVTLEGILDDGMQLYIPAQLTFDEEQYDPDLTYNVWFSLQPAGTQTGLTGGGSRMLEDPDPSDATVPVMLTVSREGFVSGDAAELTVYYIFGNRTDTSGTETVWTWEHEMTFSFTLPEAQPAVTITAPAGAVDPQTGIAITEVRLTPMRVAVVFGEHPDADVRDELSRLPVSVTLADGSVLELPEGWGVAGGVRSAYGGQDCYTIECEFGSLIDPTSVVAITVNGTDIPTS